MDAGRMFGVAGSLTSLEEMLKAEFLLRGMELCGYDLAGLGAVDLRFGEAFLTDQLATVDLPPTSANLYFADGSRPYAVRHVVATVNDITVGIVGVIDLEFQEQVEESSVIDGEPLTVHDPASELAAALDEMGETDIVVVLADMSGSAAQQFAQQLSNVDVVIAAHERDKPAGPWTVGGAQVGTVGYDGKWVIRVDFAFDAAGAGSIAMWRVVDLNSSFTDDPALVALYAEYLERLASEAEKIVESIPQETPPGGSYVGTAECQACHVEETAQWVGTKHATAFTSLVATHHDYDPSCFPCHATGFGYVGGFLLPDRTPGLMHVGCEACHGAGAEHVALPEPGWGMEPLPTSSCTGCHTAEHSPEFDMTTYFPKVRHHPPFTPQSLVGSGG